MDLLAKFGFNPNNKSKQKSLDSSFNQLAPKGAIPRWRFFLPLVLQLALIASVPATAIHTRVTGKTVILQTAPADPYSLLKGYYQVLSYDISRPNNLSKLAGWQELQDKSCQQRPKCPNYPTFLPQGTNIYVVLTSPNNSNAPSEPQPWQPVRVSDTHPQNLSPSEIALKGKYVNGEIQYGLEKYYMPELETNKINQFINQARENSRNTPAKLPFLVEIKVNSQGKAIPISLWINNYNYHF